MLRKLWLGILLSAATAVSALAQGVSLTVRGIAYDSVRREVLPNAFVTLAGIRSVTTDSRGRFEFDRVPAGVHLFEMHHALLDSMGLPGISMRTSIGEGRDRVTIAVPSFATLWRAACGDRPAPSDSGFVYGSVRDATSGALRPAAAIELAWVDLTVGTDFQFKQRILRNQTQTDANGEYSVCGVPLDQGIRMVASIDSTISGLIDLPASTLPVQRRDLYVGTADRADTSSLGGFSGVVVGDDGVPVEGARVIVDDIPQAKSNADGRFAARGVLPGSRQLEILAIGRRPLVAIVNISPGDSPTMSFTMERLSTLDVVRIIGSPFQTRLVEEFAQNKRMGFGSFLDSSDVGRRPTMISVFSALPGVEIARRAFGEFSIMLPAMGRGKCAASIWIDGIRSDAQDLNFLRPEDLAVVEVFRREFQVPSRYWSPQARCGAAVVWTKAALR